MSSKCTLAETQAGLPAKDELNGWPPPPIGKGNVRCKAHPKKGIVTALKRFMNARDRKIAKQSSEGDHLALSQKGFQLARRLSDPGQVAACIFELQEEAAAHAQRHYAKLQECKTFWHGPEGLKWLAFKKGMEPEQWSAYEEFMDNTARKALQKLLLQELVEKVDDMDEAALKALQEQSLRKLTEAHQARVDQEWGANLCGRTGASD
jgi:hypothetical protein